MNRSGFALKIRLLISLYRRNLIQSRRNSTKERFNVYLRWQPYLGIILQCTEFFAYSKKADFRNENVFNLVSIFSVTKQLGNLASDCNIRKKFFRWPIASGEKLFGIFCCHNKRQHLHSNPTLRWSSWTQVFLKQNSFKFLVFIKRMDYQRLFVITMCLYIDGYLFRCFVLSQFDCRSMSCELNIFFL